MSGTKFNEFQSKLSMSCPSCWLGEPCFRNSAIRTLGRRMQYLVRGYLKLHFLDFEDDSVASGVVAVDNLERLEIVFRSQMRRDSRTNIKFLAAEA